MDKKVLPIKYFAKRQSDNMRVEGGGGDPPKWLLEGDKLNQRSFQLTEDMNTIESEFNRNLNETYFLPVVAKAKISDNAMAKTHRKEISSLFSSPKHNGIIGLADEQEVMVRFDNIDQAKQTKQKMMNTVKYNHAISCVENVEVFVPSIIKSNTATSYKIKLINYNDYELNISAQRYFEKKCNEKNMKYKKTRYSDDLTIYKMASACIDSIIDNEEMKKTLFIIEPMPMYHVSLDSFQEDVVAPILTPEEGRNYSVVGVLDSGVANISYLKPWLLQDRWSPYPDSLVDKSHGTAVSSVMIYGDTLEGKTLTGVNGTYIFDANVFPDLNKENLEEDELLNNIKEAIDNYHKNIKIWNLSGGISAEIQDDAFSDFGVGLDSLQDKYGVIICKSTGNCNNFIKGLPKSKINKGADSVRALTVGSVAHKKDLNDLVNINYPSPFTKIGRGPNHIIKPEVVHYGGNAGVSSNGNMSMTGVKTFDINGKVSNVIGTSFSTPRVTSILAGLDAEIAEEFDPLLLKALTIHSSQYSENVLMPINDKIKQMGFGIPQNINNILYNSPNEATLILKDTLSKGEYIDILDFPMPNCLKFDGYFTGQIIATLVYNPILDAKQGAEYCQSNINLYLGTFDEKVKRDTSRVNILNPVGRSNPKNLLSADNYSKRKLSQSLNMFSKRERFLVKYGDKFYPIKKYAVDLSELTDGNKEKYLGEGRNWYMKLEGLFRDYIEKEAQLKDDIQLSQDFCLVITIRHPDKSIPVYDEVTQKLDQHNFWHNNIELKTHVSLGV